MFVGQNFPVVTQHICLLIPDMELMIDQITEMQLGDPMSSCWNTDDLKEQKCLKATPAQVTAQKAGDLEHTAQPTGSSVGLRLSFSGASVGLNLSWFLLFPGVEELVFFAAFPLRVFSAVQQV